MLLVVQKSAAQLKRDGFWEEFERELDECQTLLRLDRFTRAWSSKATLDGWTSKWWETAMDRIEGRRAAIINGMDADELTDLPLRDALIASLRIEGIPAAGLGNTGHSQGHRPQPQEPEDMNINESFPSKYLKASDIDGNPTVTIANVAEEEVGKDKEMRPVLYFDGEEKGIILNKTNATNISKLYGYETDDWRGKKVMLGTTYVDFQGQSVEAIRIYPPKRQSANAPLTQRQDGMGGREFAPPDAHGAAPLDDEIPFAPEWR